MTKTTDNQTELFYHVDENDTVLGNMTRSEAHNGTKKIHRAVGILVFNPDKSKILLQQRSLTKDTSPGYWTVSASGHVTYGHDYQQTAKKELGEEIGVTADIQEEMKVRIEDEREIEWSMLYSTTVPETFPFKLHPEEVATVRWILLKDLNEFVQNNQFSPCGKQELQAYFDFIQ